MNKRQEKIMNETEKAQRKEKAKELYEKYYGGQTKKICESSESERP